LIRLCGKPEDGNHTGWNPRETKEGKSDAEVVFYWLIKYMEWQAAMPAVSVLKRPGPR
jgi:hypothetical protein